MNGLWFDFGLTGLPKGACRAPAPPRVRQGVVLDQEIVGKLRKSLESPETVLRRPTLPGYGWASAIDRIYIIKKVVARHSGTDLASRLKQKKSWMFFRRGIPPMKQKQ